MIKFRWRKWNRVIHRDFGYFFFGMTVIYGLSGIALNHIRDWNPNYIIKMAEVTFTLPVECYNLNDNQVRELLDQIGEKRDYKKHYYPDGRTMKVFLNGGSLTIDLNSGTGFLETIKRRPVFNQVNFLHYNPNRIWAWYSDIYAGALILLAITGLFILKGKNSITGRGAWLTALGVLLPIIFLLFYL